MTYAKIDENNVVINLINIEPVHIPSETYLEENNLLSTGNYPVYIGDTYNPETKRFYRKGIIVYTYEEQLKLALDILLAGVETDV